MRRVGKKLIAFTLCALMIFTTLYGDVSFSRAEGEKYEETVTSESPDVTDEVNTEVSDDSLIQDTETQNQTVQENDTYNNPISELDVQADSLDMIMADSAEPTPEQFSEVITGATISKTTGIKMTDSLKITLNFQLPQDTEDWQLEDHYIYTYDINKIETVNNDTNKATAGLIAETTTTEPLPVIMDGVNVGTYTIVNGVVTINFKDGLSYLKRSDISRIGTFEFQCGLEEDAFDNNGGTYTLKFSSASTVVNPTISTDAKDVIKAGVKVEKSNAVFDSENKTATYTITVDNVSDDVINNLVINDTMGNYLTYDSIQTSGIDVDASGQNVKFTIASVPKGKTTFTYTCKVADGAYFNANSQGGNSSGLNNSITAKVGDKDIYIDNDSKTKQDTNFSVKKDIVGKVGTVEKNGDEEVLRWTIYINRGDSTFDLNGCTFSDILESGLTLVDGSISISGATPEIEEGLRNVINGSSPSYTFPEGSTGQYVITYTTTVPDHDGMKSYTNTASVTDGTNTDNAVAESPKIGSSLASKVAGTPIVDEDSNSSTVGELIIPWTTTIKIPTGTPTSLIYKDFMYEWYGENGKGFVEDSSGKIFTIVTSDNETLVENTDYTVSGSGLDRTITFTTEGLGKISGKTLTISYSTIGKYKDRTPNDGNNTYTNRYTLSYNDITEDGSASVVKPKDDVQSPDSFISKEATDVDTDNHTITWKITVKAGTACNIKDLILTDTIEGMEYWGYNGTECGEGDVPYVYIQDSSWMAFRYPMDIENIGDENTVKYKFTIDFTDSNKSLEAVKAWGDSSTWLNKDSFDKEFYIYYTTKVSGAKLLYNNTTTYQNSVEASATINDSDTPTTDYASASKTIDTEVLTKECEQSTLDGVNVLTYKINVNPDGLKLNPSTTQGFYTVEDTMPSNQIWINDASKTVLTNSKTGEALTRVSTADAVKSAGAGSNVYHVSYIDNVLTFTVPDETPISIVYKVTMLSDAEQGNQSYVNTVQLAEPYVSNKSTVENREQRHVSSSSMTMIGKRLFETSKVDALDTTKYLAGATFEAVEYEWDNTANTWKASGNTYTVTTDSTGRMWDESYTRAEGSTGTDTAIAKNKYYVITEKTAPYGYDVSDQIYKVIVVDTQEISATALNNLPSDVYRITAGTELIFSDMPSQTLPENKLVINKKYYKVDGVTESDTMPATNAVLEVYEGDLSLADCDSGLYTPLSTGTVEGSFTYENSNNKITLKEIPDGTYTVYEKSAPDGYDKLNVVYHFTVINHKISWEGETAEYEPEEKEIKNTETFDNSITIDKRYFKASDIAKQTPLTVVPEQAVFTVTKTHDLNESGNYVAVSGTPENMVTTDGFTYKLSKLSAGIYKIEESTSDIYDEDERLPLTITVSAIGTITITDKNGTAIAPATGASIVHRELTVDNVIKDNSFTIEKTYYDADGNVIDASTIPETDANGAMQKVTLTLFKWNGTGDKSLKASYVATAMGTDYESYSLVMAANAGEPDKYIWNNIEPGYYMAEESLKTGDTTEYEALQTVFFYVDSEYKVHVNNDAVGSYTGTTSVQNREVEGAICRFYLQKVLANQAGTEEVLITTEPASNDISFTLRRMNDGADIPFTYNPAKYRWEATGLTKGTYWVMETNWRKGYMPSEYIEFEIDTKDSSTGLEITRIKYGTAPDNTNTDDFRTSMVVEDNVETMVATLVNRPYENRLTLHKNYLQPDGTQATHTDNAVFTVYKQVNGTDTAVGTMTTTDGVNYSIGKLEPGDYIIKETSVPDGFTQAATDGIKFKVDDSFLIIVESGTGYTIGDNRDWEVDVTTSNTLSNKVVITKQFTYANGENATDTNLAALRSATEFALYDSALNEVTGKLTYTASTGIITVSDLSEGTYYIKEISNPQGFAAAADIKLDVTSDGKINVSYAGARSDFSSLYGNNTTSVTATLYNRQNSNQISIQKKYYKADGVTEIPISQVNQFASFSLTKTDGTQITGMESTVSQRTGKYTFKNLAPGTYKITETAATGYVAASDITFRVDASGNITLPSTLPSGWTSVTGDHSQSLSVVVNNSKVPNRLQLKKYYYDAAGAEVYPDDSVAANIAQFTLQDMSGNSYPLIYDRTTGLYKVDNVPSGTYSLVETAPAGYKSSGVIAVVVAEAGTISASYSGTTASDFAITGSGTTDSAFIVYRNHQVSNSITVHKSYVSATGKSLDTTSELTSSEYAEFKLYKDYGTAYQTEITGARVSSNKAQGIYTFKNLDVGEYTIVETAGAGFDTHSNITFSVYSDKSIKNLSETALAGGDDFNKDIAVTNTRMPFTNSFTLKKSFIDNNDNEVTDSTKYEALIRDTSFVIIDSDRNETDIAYDTANACYKVENLEPGEYIIREKTCPDNYIKASDINLRVVKTSPTSTIIYVQYDGLGSDIVITDSATVAPQATLNNYSGDYVYISKRTMTGSDELAGAVLCITDSNDNLIVDTDGNTVIPGWTSGTTEHAIPVNKFEKNKTYKLQEIMPPFGYERFEPVYFMINDNDEVMIVDNGTSTAVSDNLIIVRDAERSIYVSKLDDETGAKLAGAKLAITDESGATVGSEWISGDTPYELSMSQFKANEVYTLTELAAPSGYEIAKPIKFKFDLDGNLFTYNDTSKSYELLGSETIVMRDKRKDTSSSSETTDTEDTTDTEETTDTTEITTTQTGTTETGTTETSTTTTGAPKTGDNIPLVLVFIAFVISLMGISIIIKKRRDI